MQCLLTSLPWCLINLFSVSLSPKLKFHFHLPMSPCTASQPLPRSPSPGHAQVSTTAGVIPVLPCYTRYLIHPETKFKNYPQIIFTHCLSHCNCFFPNVSLPPSHFSYNLISWDTHPNSIKKQPASAQTCSSHLLRANMKRLALDHKGLVFPSSPSSVTRWPHCCLLNVR